MSWDLGRRTAENYGRPDKKRAREGTGPQIVVYVDCPGWMDMVNSSGKLVKEPKGSLRPRELAGTSSGNCPKLSVEDSGRLYEKQARPPISIGRVTKQAPEGTGPLIINVECLGLVESVGLIDSSGELLKETKRSVETKGSVWGKSSGNRPNFSGPEGVQYYRMLDSEMTTHSRHRCKYLNEKPPEKGGPNKCAICYYNHWTIHCPFWECVPPGAKVGPCFVILCQLCGHLIDNKLSCPSCGGKVEGELCYRICDCCGENMLERCRCHFLSESSISLD